MKFIYTRDLDIDYLKEHLNVCPCSSFSSTIAVHWDENSKKVHGVFEFKKEPDGFDMSSEEVLQDELKNYIEDNIIECKTAIDFVNYIKSNYECK